MEASERNVKLLPERLIYIVEDHSLPILTDQ